MAVFISHISEEAGIALVLKNLIESTFLGQWNVFVSSDSDDIPPGSRWLEQIDKALGDTRIFIILCSPISVARPWINFEAGCAWIKRIPIIPVCHSGLTTSDLRPPISTFQGLNVEDQGFPKQLLQALAKYLGVSRIPTIDYGALKEQLATALSTISTGSMQTQAIVEAPRTISDELQKTEGKILQLIAELGNGGYDAEVLSDYLEVHEQRVQHFLESLEEKDHLYITTTYLGGGDGEYYLTKKGRAYLVDHSLI